MAVVCRRVCSVTPVTFASFAAFAKDLVGASRLGFPVEKFLDGKIDATIKTLLTIYRAAGSPPMQRDDLWRALVFWDTQASDEKLWAISRFTVCQRTFVILSTRESTKCLLPCGAIVSATVTQFGSRLTASWMSLRGRRDNEFPIRRAFSAPAKMREQPH